MAGTSQDAAIELADAPDQMPNGRGFFDRIRDAVGDETFEQDFALAAMKRSCRASLLTSGEFIAWSRLNILPSSLHLKTLVRSSEFKHGVLLIEEASRCWFELLDATYGLNPAFVLAYVRGDERTSDELYDGLRSESHPLMTSGLVSDASEKDWCVLVGQNSSIGPEDFGNLGYGFQYLTPYWKHRERHFPRGTLKSVAACCRLGMDMHLILVESSPFGSFPRSSLNNHPKGAWYDFYSALHAALLDTRGEARSSNWGFALLYGTHNTEHAGFGNGREPTLALRFPELLQLTVPWTLQKTVTKFGAQLADAQYNAQTWPSTDTYQPLLAFRRNIADLHICFDLARENATRVLSLEDSRDLQAHVDLAFQHLKERVDQMSRELKEEIQLIIGAVTIQEADMARQQNDRATLLTLLAAIYLPLTLVSGIFGMNIRETSDGKPGFWWCLVVLALVAILTLIAYLGFKRWQRRQRLSYARRRKEDNESGLWPRRTDASNSETGTAKRGTGFGRIARFFKAKVK